MLCIRVSTVSTNDEHVLKRHRCEVARLLMSFLPPPALLTFANGLPAVAALIHCALVHVDTPYDSFSR
jgi:hypothetical protein